ncbi:glycoside hydrolase family 1 [Caldicellulosiruptor hydrothermalis 108]|uniref:Glycoside hydrolase family 1 n=1 Tax=Caldicellulosiruptor hydrothermalis (strain DSM 18901 / VKM B-2411 / 108) TaxID=632292 RepID=E4Q8S4_CALH1|nr:family 1 glycosylhydrolase [Caldicellulosiruptor hydrothermalis]ADQ08048.1 glycoside hydrolase family 1 [Caldicellulosiruptor hydrothermalis 108]
MLDIFQYPEVKFPDSFLWGASTAGEQVEGNNCSQFDVKEFAPEKAVFSGEPYQMPGMACNSYILYEEDIKLLKEMNLNLYRMSIEWCRIEPEKGKYDEKVLKHYISILSRLKEEKINICLTLHHFSHPVWFHKEGAFKSLDNLKDWERYLEYLIPKIAEYVDFWIVINELNLRYVYPTIEERLNAIYYHALGYHIIKKYSDKPVSSAHSYAEKHPKRGKHDKLDRLMAEYIDYIENEFFFHAIRTGEITAPFYDAKYVPDIKMTCDFWAVNTYVRHIIDGRKKDYLTDFYRATHFKALDTPFYTEEIWPELMIFMLMRLKDKPILITENGIAVRDDRFRIVYLAAMLQSVYEAIEMGSEVIGYCHWSLLDNWEWGSFEPTFGLAAVDRKTFERRLKNSGKFYGEIAKNNGYNQEILRRYLQELPSIINYKNK